MYCQTKETSCMCTADSSLKTKSELYTALAWELPQKNIFGCTYCTQQQPNIDAQRFSIVDSTTNHHTNNHQRRPRRRRHQHHHHHHHHHHHQQQQCSGSISIFKDNYQRISKNTIWSRGKVLKCHLSEPNMFTKHQPFIHMPPRLRRSSQQCLGWVSFSKVSAQ